MRRFYAFKRGGDILDTFYALLIGTLRREERREELNFLFFSLPSRVFFLLLFVKAKCVTAVFSLPFPPLPFFGASSAIMVEEEEKTFFFSFFLLLFCHFSPLVQYPPPHTHVFLALCGKKRKVFGQGRRKRKGKKIFLDFPTKKLIFLKKYIPIYFLSAKQFCR